MDYKTLMKTQIRKPILPALNPHYALIQDAGFDLSTTSQHGGIAFLYLMKEGNRVQGSRIAFKSNNQSTSILTRKLALAREHTHLGGALKKMAYQHAGLSCTDFLSFEQEHALELATLDMEGTSGVYEEADKTWIEINGNEAGFLLDRQNLRVIPFFTVDEQVLKVADIRHAIAGAKQAG